MEDNKNVFARGLFYVATRIILVVILIIVIWLGFSIGQQTMNVYVITKDAFAKRAEMVLANGDTDEDILNNMYTQNFLMNDQIYNTTDYDDYKVANYYQRNDVKWKVVLPWQDKVTLDATEEIYNITGEYSGEIALDENGNPVELTDEQKNPPLWNNGVYKVTLIKVDDKWKIDSMEMTEVIEPPVEEEEETEETPQQDTVEIENGDDSVNE